MTAPSDLTTLADCKAWLGVTSTADDAQIAGLIAAVSRAILADLGREIVPTAVVETLDGGGEASLLLRQWPVTSVTSCLVDGVAVAPSSLSGRVGTVLDAAAGAPPGCPQRLNLTGGSFPRGFGNVVVAYRAGYEIIAEAAIVPASAPYVVAALAPFGAWASDTGVSGVPGAYTAADGLYTFSSAAAGAPITLSYGYVPADLARAAIEWVADRYAGRTRIGQSTRSLGGQETAGFIVKAMPDVVAHLIQPYRRIV